MKHKIYLLLVLCLTFLLSACGVSQEDYDLLAEENKSLEGQVESLQSEAELLYDENESLRSENESLSAEKDSLLATAESLLNEQAEQLISEMDTAYGKAWVTASFGDNSICYTDGNTYLQCISEKTYEISDDGLAELWTDFISSVQTLGYMNNIYPDKIPHDVSVKFYDPSGIYIVEFNIKIAEDSSTSFTSMCNIVYAYQIMQGLSKASK